MAEGSLWSPKPGSRGALEGTALPAGEAGSPRAARPWTLPPAGLAVFHGTGEVARLSHYFLPRLLREGKDVLMLDGANSADPRLLARLARERGVAFEVFNRQVQIARAFTCFQLTELARRVPQFLRDFPARVLIVTAFPDLYFDEDIRDWDARVAFEQALAYFRRWASRGSPTLSVAIFSASASLTPPPARRGFFDEVDAAAREVWRFTLNTEGKVGLSLETTARGPFLVAGRRACAAGSRVEE